MRLGAVIALGLVFGLHPAQSAEQLTRSLAMDQLGITLRHPEGWSATFQDERAWIVNAPLAQATGTALSGLAQVFVTAEHRANHEDAVRRLREIASEFDAPVEYLTISGWPAMQRRVVTPKEQPGAQGLDAPEQQIVRITTAIAAGNLLIRAEGRMLPDAGEQVAEQIRAIESNVIVMTAGNQADAQRTVEELRAVPRLGPLQPPPSRVKPAAPPEQHGLLQAPRRLFEGAYARSEEEDEPGESVRGLDIDNAGAAARVINGGFASEAEIAVSTDGQKIVVAQQFQFATSNDGGLTFPTTGNFPFGWWRHFARLW
jgi:hypothetical protein